MYRSNAFLYAGEHFLVFESQYTGTVLYCTELYILYCTVLNICRKSGTNVLGVSPSKDWSHRLFFICKALAFIRGTSL